MNTRHPPRFTLGLMERLIDDEALIGDLLEGWRDRSDWWLWRQVLLSAASRVVYKARSAPRVAIETVLLSTAILLLLGLYAVGVASLLSFLTDDAWPLQTGRYQRWELYSIVPSFAVAVLIGQGINRLHGNHHLTTVFLCSGTAAAAACVNQYLFVPNAFAEPFGTAAPLQIVLSMVFIAGLFSGVGTRSSCEPLPSS
jgi:hypothetical protein